MREIMNIYVACCICLLKGNSTMARINIFIKHRAWGIIKSNKSEAGDN